jgi:hypothetical protein
MGFCFFFSDKNSCYILNKFPNPRLRKVGHLDLSTDMKALFLLGC